MQNEPMRPAAGPQAEEVVNLRHYWHVILARRWLMLATFVTIMAMVAVYLFKAERIYAATTRLQIDRDPGNALNISDIYTLGAESQEYLQTQYKNLQTRALLHMVMQELKLQEHSRYKLRMDPVAAFRSDVTISPIRLSRLVDIKVEFPDPQMAMDAANLIANTFIKQDLDVKIAKPLEYFNSLQTEATKMAAKVSEAEQKLLKYQRDAELGSLDESQNMVLQALKQARTDYDKARSEASSAERIAQEAQRILDEGKPIETLPQVADSKVIQDIKVKLATAESELGKLLQRYKERYVAVVETRKQIEEYRTALQKEAANIVQTLKNQGKITRATADSLGLELKKQEKASFDLAEKKVQYLALERTAKTFTTAYNMVLTKVQETELVSKSKTQNIRVVDAAIKPIRPVRPMVTLTLVIGAFMGLLASMGLAFTIDYLDDSVKSQEDVEIYLRLNFLGYVPNIKTTSVIERDLQAHLHPQSSSAEGFRTLRAAVSLTRGGDKLHAIAVTSTIPSEGKSLTASNLAIVLAQTGLKTLLVDADLRRPSVHKSFQLQSPVGLAAYLQERVNSVDEFIHSTEVPNLDVVCCGAVPQTPSELVGSKRMVQFIDEVKKRYDRVIMDCPPVSAVSDPLIISAMVDGVVFVTKFNKIRREHARRSVQRLEDAGIHIIGLVLNDIDFEGRDSYYYSYYYYQNRYYASHYQTKADPDEKKPAGTAKS